jgi:4'-phosphopantetheinyl transferase EntD
VIEEILHPGVAAAEAFDDCGDPDLFPEERAVVARAVPSRQREFATTRRCARLAMASLGIPAAPLLPGEAMAPQWPAAVVGSMTHCDGYRAAAVALSRAVRGIGIDAEPDEPLPDGVVDLVALPAERAWLAALRASRPDVHWDRLLFSCKESVYKAWYPLARRWLGFDEALVRIDPAAGTFSAELLVPGPVVDGAVLRGFSGRWMARGGLLLTVISMAVPSPGARAPAVQAVGFQAAGLQAAGLQAATDTSPGTGVRGTECRDGKSPNAIARLGSGRGGLPSGSGQERSIRFLLAARTPA